MPPKSTTPNSRVKLHLGRFFPELEAAFLEAVRQRAESDPLSPVWVLAPTGALQRRLGERIARSGGAIGIRFFGFETLAEELARYSPNAASKSLLPPGGELLLLEEILRQEKLGYFEPSRDEPRLAQALLTSLRDLKDAGISAEEFAAVQKGKSTDKLSSLSRLYSHYESRLAKKNLIDRSELILEAKRSVESGKVEELEQLHLIVYGVYDFTGLQRGLLQALVEHAGKTSVFFPPESEFSKPALAFFKSVGADFHVRPQNSGEHGSPPLQQPILISAAGVAEEVRELIREIQALESKGLALDEIGVVARSLNRYESVLREAFAKAEIPLSLAKPGSLARSAEGRAFLLLLQIDPKAPTRSEVFSWLSLPQANLEALSGSSESSPFYWDFLFREAGIARLEDGWEAKLQNLDAPHHDPALRAVRTVTKFLKALRSIPNSAAPSKMAAALRGLISGGEEGGHDSIVSPFLSVDGGQDRILSPETFDLLAQLDLACDRIERAKLPEILSRLFEEVKIEERSAGVFCGDALAARGLSFRALFILGMEEKEFPHLPRVDPILLDSERDAISRRISGKYLQSKSRSRFEEEYLFELFKEAATEQLFFLRSRLDPVTGREIPASIFLKGYDLKAERQAPLKFWSSEVRAEAVNALEFDLRVLDSIRRGLPENAREYLQKVYPPNIGYGLQLEAERWKFGKLSKYDGAVGAGNGERGHDSIVSPFSFVSPSKFEAIAKCPFQFFLRSILKVQEFERPEDEDELDARKLGSLVHKVLAAFFKSLDHGKKLSDYSAESLNERLERIFLNIWTEQEKLGIPGSWADREAIRAQSLSNLKKYIQDQREDGYPVPAEMEWKIPKDIFFSTGKHRFALEGRVDRIDLEGKALRIVDFKTGKLKGHVGCLDGGKRLQVSLYAHAAAEHFKPETITGEYHYLKDGKKARPAFLGQVPEVTKTVEALLHLSERGLYPQFPEASEFGNCKFCEYKLICAGEQYPVYERKRSDPRLAEFLKIREEEECPALAKATKKGKKS